MSASRHVFRQTSIGNAVFTSIYWIYSYIYDRR